MSYADFLTGVYQEQLGRAPDAEGLAYWSNQLAAGASQQDVLNAINTSKEGQNFDTQSITSEYRSLLGRNPEQEGYQYWLSVAQSNPGISGDVLQNYISQAAQTTPDAAALQRALTEGYYTNLQLPSFEADPYGGRYTSESRYVTTADAYPNVSKIGENMYQFMSPITQQPVISEYAPNTWAAKAGLDVLSAPQVDAAIDLAFKAGTMDQKDYERLYRDLATASTMDDVYAAFNKPQGQVVVDALYGFQTGEGKTLAEAQAEAQVRQQYLDEFGYYPSNFAMADVLTRAGVDYPFTQEQMDKMGKMYTWEDVVTAENFQDKINQIMKMSFGGADYMKTPLGGGYFSERGFEPTFTPMGEAPTFRSGVAGYIPETQLPQGFEFGVLPVMAQIKTGPQGFQPNEFDIGNYDEQGNLIKNPAPMSGSGWFVGAGGQIFPTQAEAQASLNAGAGS